MPKAKVERIISDDGVSKTVEVEVGERNVTKVARYTVPSTAKAAQEFVLNLTDTPDDGATYVSIFGEPDEEATRARIKAESPLSLFYRLYVSSVDRKARADIYESLAAESTTITVGKEKVNILEFPLKRMLMAINGIRSQVDVRTMAGGDTPEARIAAEKSVGFGPWRTAARKLCEGYINEAGEKVAPLAREDEASGMLVALEMA